MSTKAVVLLRGSRNSAGPRRFWPATAALISEEDNKRSFDWLELERIKTLRIIGQRRQLDRRESDCILMAIFSSLASYLAKSPRMIEL